jgi:hypothetical protein
MIRTTLGTGASDKERALVYVRKRRYYFAGRPRKRFRPVLVGCAVIGFAALCLWARCARAGVMQATITGTLNADDPETAAMFFNTVFPTPFVATFQWNSDAVDERLEDNTIGLYNSGAPKSAPLDPSDIVNTLRFGDYFYSSGSSEEVVWSQPSNYGYQFVGRGGDIGTNGFHLREFFAQFLFQFPVIAMDDTLASIQEYDLDSNGSLERMLVGNSDYYDGGPRPLLLLSDTENGIASLTITEVPEPHEGLLAALGCALLMGSRVRKF